MTTVTMVMPTQERVVSTRAQAMTRVRCWKHLVRSRYHMKDNLMKQAILVCFLLLIAPVLHAQTWSALPVDLIVPMDTSTPGTPLTTAIANAGTVSSVCTVGSQCYFESLPEGAFEVGAYQGCSNLGPVQMNGTGGTLYPAQSLNHNNYAHLDSANDVIGNFAFSGVSSKNITVTTCLTLGFPGQSNGNDWDMIMIQDVSGLYADMQFNNECPSFGVRIENHPVQHSACINLTPQQTYYFSMNWDLTNGIATLFVFSEQGTFIGNAYVTDTGGSLNNIRLFSNENGTNSGTYSYYQNIMMRWAAKAPSGTLAATNGSTTITGSGFAADNSWNHAFIYIAGQPYTIASVQSSTSLTLTTAFSGTTGTASYIVETPLFWASTGSQPQPPTVLNATVNSN